MCKHKIDGLKNALNYLWTQKTIIEISYQRTG